MKKKNVKKKLESFIKMPYVIAAVLSAVVLVSAFAVVRSARNKEATEGAKIYFFDSQTSVLKFENRLLPEGTNPDKIRFVLEELVLGPRSAMLLPSVPANIVKSAEITGANVEVTVTGEYLSLTSDEEIVCRAALVSTLTDLDFISTVSINVNGGELTKPNGQPLGSMKAGDIVAAPEINPQGESSRTIRLYFADLGYTGLAAETRTISTNPNESMAKYIMLELINGPESGGLAPTVPPETKLIDINITDGVCNVDLSKDFITRHAAGRETLSVYSIVNSLSEQSDIKTVLFLIEGARQEQFGNESGFNKLYEAADIPVGTITEEGEH